MSGSTVKNNISWKRYSDTVQYGELRSNRGSWFTNEFLLKLVYLKIIKITLQQSCQVKVWLDRYGWDPCGIDHFPATMSSKHFGKQERWDPCYSQISEEQLLTRPTKNPKSTRNENNEQELENPYYSDIPEWLQEVIENLVDDRVPERRDSHASSSHEATRSADLGKHSILISRRNCEIYQRTRSTRAPCRRRYCQSRTSCRKFWWLDNSRSKSSQWTLWISKQSSICNRGAGSSLSMVPGVSVQKQNFTRNPEKLAKIPGTRKETKSHLH